MFDEYCKDESVRRHRSVRHTPQQNGVAERMNRTLLNKSRCTMFGSGLEEKFWDEAVVTASYLINRSLSSLRLPRKSGPENHPI